MSLISSLGFGKSARVAVHTRQCLPSGTYDAMRLVASNEGIEVRVFVLGRRELVVPCFLDGTRRKDVVELFLLDSILFLIVSRALLVEHFDDSFEIAMGCVIDLHLAFALQFQRLQLNEELFLIFSNRLDCMFECSQFAGWNQVLHRVLSRFVRVCNIYIEGFNLASDSANFDLNRIEIVFCALLRVLPNQKHSRE